MMPSTLTFEHQNRPQPKRCKVVITKCKYFLLVNSLDTTCTLNLALISKFRNELRRLFRFVCAFSGLVSVVPSSTPISCVSVFFIHNGVRNIRKEIFSIFFTVCDSNGLRKHRLPFFLANLFRCLGLTNLKQMLHVAIVALQWYCSRSTWKQT